jgi:hypothetical protein
MMVKNPSQIPNYLTASSPRGLRRLMLLTNVRLKAFIQYFDIQQTSDGKWVAWFFEDVEIQDPLLKEDADGSVE